MIILFCILLAGTVGWAVYSLGLRLSVWYDVGKRLTKDS